MRLIGFAFAGFLACCQITTASAKVYTLTYTGTIAYTAASMQGEAATPNPQGAAFKVGDTFSASLRFDTSAPTLTNLYNADPAINLYYLSQPVILSFNAGSYRWNEIINGSRLTVQLWNNRDISAGLTGSSAAMLKNVDSQSFAYQRNSITDPQNPSYPIDMGSGRISDSLTFYMFDYSGTVRSSDLIKELDKPALFGSKSLEYSAYNADTKRFFFTNVNVVGTSLTAVPEPETWAMFIGGFGLVGSVMRNRKKVAITFA